MSEPNLATQLSTLIRKQHENATTLKSLLQEEQYCLLEDKTEQLMTVIEQKERVAQQMATIQNQLSTLAIQQSPSGAAPQGLIQFIRTNDSNGALQQQWEALLETTRSCKQLNEANGSAINLKKRYADSGLAILRGQTGNSSAATYTKKGVTSARQGSHILHKA